MHLIRPRFVHWSVLVQTKILTARIPLPLAEQVDQLAKRRGRSRAAIVEAALAAFVELEEERHRLTLEGLADVAAGRVVDHEAVQAWADSLDSDNPLPIPK